MSKEDALQIFERAAEARGRLLRVQADRSGREPSRLLLTFDVGRVLVEPGVGTIAAVALTDAKTVPPNLRVLEDDEPWWRLLGQPLTAVSKDSDSRALELRFREDNENPRVVRLESKGTSLSIALAGSGEG